MNSIYISKLEQPCYFIKDGEVKQGSLSDFTHFIETTTRPTGIGYKHYVTPVIRQVEAETDEDGNETIPAHDEQLWAHAYYQHGKENTLGEYKTEAEAFSVVEDTYVRDILHNPEFLIYTDKTQAIGYFNENYSACRLTFSQDTLPVVITTLGRDVSCLTQATGELVAILYLNDAEMDELAEFPDIEIAVQENPSFGHADTYCIEADAINGIYLVELLGDPEMCQRLSSNDFIESLKTDLDWTIGTVVNKQEMGLLMDEYGVHRSPGGTPLTIDDLGPNKYFIHPSGEYTVHVPVIGSKISEKFLKDFVPFSDDGFITVSIKCASSDRSHICEALRKDIAWGKASNDGSFTINASITPEQHYKLSLSENVHINLAPSRQLNLSTDLAKKLSEPVSAIDALMLVKQHLAQASSAFYSLDSSDQNHLMEFHHAEGSLGRLRHLETSVDELLEALGVERRDQRPSGLEM